MPSIEFKSVQKTFGRTRALDDISLTVDTGRFTVVCGPPASGKSTLFRVLVGLERVDAGRILADGNDITDLPPGRRNFGYVPQSFALYPHLSVYDNIAYPLRLAGTASSEIAARIDRATGMLSIGHLVRKTPDQLSGGEKQRVAVARGLLTQASVFVFDDPLVGLDYKLRERLMDDLKALSEELKATFFYATSDSLEALTMAQDLIVMDAGRVVEKADVLDLYREPQFARTLELIGFPKANVWEAEVRDGAIALDELRFSPPPGTSEGRVRLGIRPEDVRVNARGEVAADGTVGMDAKVSILEHLGSEIVVYLERNGRQITAALSSSGTMPLQIDEKVRICIDPERVLLFDANSGRRIGRGRAMTEAIVHG